MKILIIDDSKADRELMINFIKTSDKIQNLVIDESNCMKNAIERIRNNDYDVILLDIILPETDGIQTVKTLTEEMNNLEKNTPIVIITGHEDYRILREAFSLGIKDFLIKDELMQGDISRALIFAVNGNKVQKSFSSAAR